MRLRILVAFAVAVLLQVAVLPSIRISGVHPEALVVLAVAGGLTGGAERGAGIGFAAGLLADLFLRTPLGLSALAYCLVGFAIGAVQGNLLRPVWWMVPLTGLAGCAMGVALYALIGAVVGQDGLVGPRFPVIVAVVAVAGAVLSPLAVWALKSPEVAPGAMPLGVRRGLT